MTEEQINEAIKDGLEEGLTRTVVQRAEQAEYRLVMAGPVCYWRDLSEDQKITAIRDQARAIVPEILDGLAALLRARPWIK